MDVTKSVYCLKVKKYLNIQRCNPIRIYIYIKEYIYSSI